MLPGLQSGKVKADYGAVEKRSDPKGHHGLLCYAANRTAQCILPFVILTK